MKNWAETIKALSVEDSDNTTDLKIKGGQLLILKEKLKQHKKDQQEAIFDEAKVSDVNDRLSIIKIYDELITEVCFQEELIDMRLSQLNKLSHINSGK